MTTPDIVTAFAPGSVGNVGVGFDILGHTVSVVGDRVSAQRTAERGVRITQITGCVTDLPFDPESNTASVAVLALLRAVDADFGVELTIHKGVPRESGLGGSAASAVAGAVAANGLLAAPLDVLDLLPFACEGEKIASGTPHLDNIAASLYGGLVLVAGLEKPLLRKVPVPPTVRCVLVRPHMQLATRMARTILSSTVPLPDAMRQQVNLAGFLSGCYTNDIELIRASLEDAMIEPQRKRLIPGFDAVKEGALSRGALGCSISGAGPTVFAWCEEPRCEEVRAAMVAAFERCGLGTDAWISRIDSPGAHLLDRE